MSVIPFPRQPATPIDPPSPYWPDQTVMHLLSRKFGEVRFVGGNRIVVLLDDGCQIAVPAYELRPVPRPMDVGVVIGGRA